MHIIQIDIFAMINQNEGFYQKKKKMFIHSEANLYSYFKR